MIAKVLLIPVPVRNPLSCNASKAIPATATPTPVTVTVTRNVSVTPAVRRALGCDDVDHRRTDPTL